MNAKPVISVVVVSWNTCAYLHKCLHSIYGTLGALQPGQVEVIVVDNASVDGSVEMVLKQYPQVLLIRNQENVGFARANNQAIKGSRGRYILLLNSDTEGHPGALQALVEFMDAHPRAGACGARLLNR